MRVPMKHPRFAEPAKFLPVAFVSSNIIGLYLIYTFLHLVPMLRRVGGEKTRATVECAVFQCATLLLAICYIRSILVHPGEIPDREEDPSWDYAGQPGHGGRGAAQESKRSGERRYCKWCAKYKPDRCHHCRVCRTCILKMDHHCPWIYNCVGFKNHKFFFLLLVYSCISCHIIMWTMAESVKSAVAVDSPFLVMFFLLFGETLAAFLGILVTGFLGFHIWLMLRAMTTIEFCEKSVKKSGYGGSSYDLGSVVGNIKAVLGSNPLLWLLPICPPAGDGLSFDVGEVNRLLGPAARR